MDLKISTTIIKAIATLEGAKSKKEKRNSNNLADKTLTWLSNWVNNRDNPSEKPNQEIMYCLTEALIVYDTVSRKRLRNSIKAQSGAEDDKSAEFRQYFTQQKKLNDEISKAADWVADLSNMQSEK